MDKFMLILCSSDILTATLNEDLHAFLHVLNVTLKIFTGVKNVLNIIYREE
jgi:hypothetical protein